MTSGSAKFFGVTPKYPDMHTLAEGESRGGWNDEAMQAFTGLLLDRTNMRMGWENAERVVADAKKYGVTLLMQFESAPAVEHAREAVTRFNGRVKCWEIVNEPNFSMSPQAYADFVKQIYPVIKSIDPEAVVMGPDTCGISVTGYNDVPTFVFSESGPRQAALVCRTRAAMIRAASSSRSLIWGRRATRSFSDSATGGGDGETVTLRNYGCPDIPVEVEVAGGDSLEVVDAFGNVQAVPVKGGRAAVTVSQWPSYLRTKGGQKVTVAPWDFGRNIAGEATFECSAGTNSPSKILTDGLFQDYYPDQPFGEDWKGSYAGKVFNEKPETLDIVFGQPRMIDKLLICGVRSDNPFSAILDYDLQYSAGGKWVTLEEVRVACPPSDVVTTYMDQKTMMWYQDNNFFVHRFKKPVKTDKLRIVVRRVTRGCLTDMIVETALNAGKPADQYWQASGQWLQLREIEVYGPPPPLEISGRLASVPTGQLPARLPVTLTVMNHTSQPAKVRARAEVAGWKVEPGEVAVDLPAGGAKDFTLALAPPSLVAAGETPVKLALVGEKGEALDSRELTLALAAPVRVTPQPARATENGVVFPLTIEQVDAQLPSLKGKATAKVFVAGKTVVLEQSYGPTAAGDQVWVEFETKTADLTKGVQFSVVAGRHLVEAGLPPQLSWQVAGPFPNEGRAAFDKVFPPGGAWTSRAAMLSPAARRQAGHCRRARAARWWTSRQCSSRA